MAVKSGQGPGTPAVRMANWGLWRCSIVHVQSRPPSSGAESTAPEDTRATKERPAASSREGDCLSLPSSDMSLRGSTPNVPAYQPSSNVGQRFPRI